MSYRWPRAPRYAAHQRMNCRGGCQNGKPRWHHSKEEARYCDCLLLLKKSGEIRSYESQVRYDLRDRNGLPCGWMVVDFKVKHANGKIKIHEYKGSFFGKLMEYRTKKALFSWCYPALEYVTVGKKEIVI